MSCDVMEWNGMERNGTEWNGMEVCMLDMLVFDAFDGAFPKPSEGL